MLRPALEGAGRAPHLAAGGRGRLVFLTARSVVEATPDLALSSVMRSGVAAAARSLAIELAPDVLVNVVVTGQFEHRRSAASRPPRRRSTAPRPTRCGRSTSPRSRSGGSGRGGARRRRDVPVLRQGVVRHRRDDPHRRRRHPWLLSAAMRTSEPDPSGQTAPSAGRRGRCLACRPPRPAMCSSPHRRARSTSPAATASTIAACSSQDLVALADAPARRSSG